MERTTKLSKTLLGAGLAISLGLALSHGNQALAQGSWESSVGGDVAAMPTARLSPHVGAIDGLLYVAGGFSTGNTSVHEMYDPATDTWIAKAPMLSPRYAGMAGVIDGKLYVAGGWIGTGKSNTLQIYDPGGDLWSYGTSLPASVGSGVGAVIDQKFYVLGGWSNYFGVYDPVTSNWTTKTSPPQLHAGGAWGVIDGKLYVAGGNTGPSITATLHVYDPVGNSWATKAPMPTARMVAFGGVLDGKLYVTGGYDGSTVLDMVEVYDPVGDSWTTMASMPTARQQAHIGVSSPEIDGKLYMVGGHDGGGVSDTLEVFSLGNGVTIAKTLVSGPRVDVGSVLVDLPGLVTGSNDAGPIDVGRTDAQFYEFLLEVTNDGADDALDGLIVSDPIPDIYDLDPLCGDDPVFATTSCDTAVVGDVDRGIDGSDGYADGIINDTPSMCIVSTSSGGGTKKAGDGLEPEFVSIELTADLDSGDTCTVRVFVRTDENPSKKSSMFEPARCRELDIGVFDTVALNEGVKLFDPDTGDRLLGPVGSLQLTPNNCP